MSRRARIRVGRVVVELEDRGTTPSYTVRCTEHGLIREWLPRAAALICRAAHEDVYGCVRGSRPIRR